jgi:hypothetical protein
MFDNFVTALKLVYQKRGRILLTVFLFLLIFTLYLFLLPSSFTGAKIGFFSLKFLTPLMVLIAFLLAFFLSFTLTFVIYSWSLRVKTAGTTEGFGAALLAIIPGLLCCSPFIPTLLVVLGASTPAIFGLTGPLQGFFVTYSLHFYIVSLLLVIWAFYLAAKNLASVCKIKF